MGWEDAPVLAPTANPAPSGPKQPWESAPLISRTISPDTTKTIQNVVRDNLQSSPKPVTSPGDAFMAGLGLSDTGLAISGHLPNTTLDPKADRLSTFANGLGQVLGDLPVMVAGGLIGGGPASPITATAGAFALSQGIRRVLMDSYARGESSSLADIWQPMTNAVLDTAKGWITGAATAAVGGVVGRALAPAPAVLSAPVNVAAQAATMETVGSLLDGHAPTADGILNAAILVGGLKTAHVAADAIRGIYTRTGIPPEQVVADAKANPAIKEAVSKGVFPDAYRAKAVEENAKMAVPGEQAAVVAESPFAAIPQAAGEPALPTHINYNYINTTEDAQGAMSRLSQVYEQQIQTQRRGTVGWEETSKDAAKILADALGMRDERLLLPREPGTPAGAAEILARKQMTIGAAEDMATKAKDYLAKGGAVTADDTVSFLASIERAALIQSEFLGARAEAGRSLNILKSTKTDARRVERILDMMNTAGKNPIELAKILGEIDNPAGALAMAKDLQKATRWEKFVEGMRAWYVSGPITQMANILGNVTLAGLRMPIDVTASLVGGMTRGGDQARLADPALRLWGNMAGARDGLIIVGKGLRSGQLDYNGKTESHKQAIEGTLGSIIRTPFTGLSAVDAIFRTTAERGEGYVWAGHQAIKEGLGMHTPDFYSRVAELMQNPPAEMTEAMETMGQRMTATAPLGEKGRSMQMFIKSWHLEPLVPFTTAPTNLGKELARMTPLAPFIEEWRRDIQKGGAPANRAVAEVMVGAMVMGSVMSYVGTNGPVSITGGTDKDYTKRYRITIGDKSYSYQRIQPIGTLIGLAADIEELRTHMTPDEQDKLPKMLATAFANAMTNQVFLMGITNFSRALSDPDQFMARFIQGTVAGVVPGAVAQVAQMHDPYVREIYSVTDAIKARLPWMREGLMMRRDTFGEPMLQPDRPGWISPITAIPVEKDPVRTEMSRLQIDIHKAPSSISLPSGPDKKLGQVKLTPEQRDIFGDIAGHQAYQILSPIVNDPAWKTTPDLVKKRIYDKVFEKTNKAGKAAALTPEQRAQEAQRITDSLRKQLEVPE